MQRMVSPGPVSTFRAFATCMALLLGPAIASGQVDPTAYTPVPSSVDVGSWDFGDASWKGSDPKWITGLNNAGYGVGQIVPIHIVGTTTEAGGNQLSTGVCANPVNEFSGFARWNRDYAATLPYDGDPLPDYEDGTWDTSRDDWWGKNVTIDHVVTQVYADAGAIPDPPGGSTHCSDGDLFSIVYFTVDNAAGQDWLLALGAEVAPEAPKNAGETGNFQLDFLGANKSLPFVSTPLMLDLTVSKSVDTDGDGEVDLTGGADSNQLLAGYTFAACPITADGPTDPACVSETTGASGQVVFTVPAAVYHIYETDLPPASLLVEFGGDCENLSDPARGWISLTAESNQCTVVNTLPVPSLTVTKTVMPAGGVCGEDDVDVLTLVGAGSVQYCYRVENAGGPLLDVTLFDDNATPDAPGDDFEISLDGLDELGGNPERGDLPAGGTASGVSEPIEIPEPEESSSRTNIGVVSGQSMAGEPFSGQDDATVTSKPATGGLTVVKSISWNGVAPVETTFEICIQGPSYPDGTEPGACQEVTTDSGGEMTWDDLEPGDYVVTETDPGADWEDAEIIGSPATVSGGETALAEVINSRIANPSLALDKAFTSYADLDESDDISLGDELTYTITATNTGDVTLTGVEVGDPMLTPDKEFCESVAPGETCVLTGSYIVTADDVEAGQVDNTATADSDQTEPVEDQETTEVQQHPKLTVEKELTANADGDGSGDISAGDVLTYEITASNEGDVTLSNVVVGDQKLTPPSTTCEAVPPGETCVLTGTYTVTEEDVQKGTIENIGTADSDQTEPVSVQRSDDVAQRRSLAVEKVLTSYEDNDDSDDVSLGDLLTYTVTATNTGNVSLSGVVVTDAKLTPDEKTCATLAPGATCELVGTYTVTAADVEAGKIDNTGGADSDQTDPVTDDVSTDVQQNPELMVEKVLTSNADNDDSGDVSMGDVLTYTVTATNSGDVTLTNVVVSDAKLTPAEKTCATLEPSGTCVLVGTYTVTQADAEAGMIDNTGSADSDQTTPVTDDESVDVIATASLAVEKVLTSNADNDGSGGVSLGDVLTYTVTATNTGDVTLTNVVVEDEKLTPAEKTCESVAPGATCVLAGTHTVTPADVQAGHIDNVGTADSDQTTPVADEVSTEVGQNPSLSLKKGPTANDDRDGSGDLTLGDVLTFTVTATNTGDVTLTNVVVTDPQLTPTTKTCASVAPGATCVLVGTYTVTQKDVDNGRIWNVATVKSDQTVEVKANDSTDVQQNPSLSLKKGPTANDDRDGSGSLTVGDVLTFTVTATNTGDMTLTNVVVGDPQLTPATKTCASVAPGATCVLVGTYTVTQEDANAGRIWNVATVKSDQTDEVKATDSTDVSQNPDVSLTKELTNNADNDESGDLTLNDVLTYTITATNTGDVTLENVKVADEKLTPSEVVCPSLAPGESCVLVGTYTVTLADADAGQVDNKATVTSNQIETGTDQRSDPVGQHPSLAVVKEMTENEDNDGSEDVSQNDVLTYTVTATNTGDVTLTNVTVQDPLITPSSATCEAVAPEATCVLTGTYTVTEADRLAGAISNTGSADSEETDPVTADLSIDVSAAIPIATEEETIPTEYGLDQNYPNPFNPSTTIRFHLPESVDVTITVFDALGRRVEQLAHRQYGAGTHSVRWNAQLVPSGVYFYVIQAGSYYRARQMMLLE